MSQMHQIQIVTDKVDSYMTARDLPDSTLRLIVGDLNVCEDDPVCMHLRKKGYKSSFTSLHGTSMAKSVSFMKGRRDAKCYGIRTIPICRIYLVFIWYRLSPQVVSHLNHNGVEELVDHCFVKRGNLEDSIFITPKCQNGEMMLDGKNANCVGMTYDESSQSESEEDDSEEVKNELNHKTVLSVADKNSAGMIGNSVKVLRAELLPSHLDASSWNKVRFELSIEKKTERLDD
jgi:hypothetical protein